LYETAIPVEIDIENTC